MDTCKKCNNELNFWEVFKSFWLLYRTVSCNFCGAIQQHAERNRYLGGLVMIFTFLFTIRLLFAADFDSNMILAYIGVMAITAGVFSIIAVQFMRFNILQTQRSKDNKR